MINIEQIKKLREKTGAGINHVREALAFAEGNDEKALEYLRNKGMLKALKRGENEVNNGVIGVYRHKNSQIVTVVQIRCETDFAAKSQELLDFANNIAIHFAGVESRFIDVKDLDENTIKILDETINKELGSDLENKKAEVLAKIIEGKKEKFYSENVLHRQNYFLDESIKVVDVINTLVSKIGEKIVIYSASKFQVGKEALNITSK